MVPSSLVHDEKCNLQLLCMKQMKILLSNRPIDIVAMAKLLKEPYLKPGSRVHCKCGACHMIVTVWFLFQALRQLKHEETVALLG